MDEGMKRQCDAFFQQILYVLNSKEFGELRVNKRIDLGAIKVLC